MVPDITFEYTPTRSPTKRAGPAAAAAARPKLGNMGPPPVPVADLNVGFMTPKPLTASSRKARVLESKSALSGWCLQGVCLADEECCG